SGLRKTNVRSNSLAHRTTWLRSDLMLIMKMSVLGMKRISTMGSDRSEKEIVGYCTRNISRFCFRSVWK
ncbi:hypothetical protein PTB13_21110, partial [Bacillus sp. MHSD17]|nr:hypothetical protein [Bacillus sp. MHSD17]